MVTAQQLQSLFTQAKRYGLAATQDESIVIQQRHLNYAVALMESLLAAANDEQLVQAGITNARGVLDKLKEYQDKVSEELMDVCDGLSGVDDQEPQRAFWLRTAILGGVAAMFMWQGRGLIRDVREWFA